VSERHILTVSLGPVQDFIAAARRTADLQAGSGLLVAMAKAAARAIKSCAGDLLIPADPERDGPNKILAVVAEPAVAANAAREAAQKVLDDRWADLKSDKDIGPHLDAAIGDDQIGHFLEFYAAWEPVPDDPEAFGDARSRAERRLAGRKALRDFEQPLSTPKDVPGRPKSPLDPSRDTVLKLDRYNEPVPQALQQKDTLWLKPREYLDAVSLVKRHLGGHGVPSTCRMAIRPWLEMLKQAPGYDELKRLIDDTHGAVDLGAAFLRQDLGREVPKGSAIDVRAITEKAGDVARAIRPHTLQPYYAILAADGDNMGRRLGRCRTMKEIQAFSGKVTAFAEKAREVVEKHYGGHAVYCGGDDVLALLPVNSALQCGDALRKTFSDCMGDAKATLSVGIAIVHHIEDLQQSVRLAREAERRAKDAGRNSLCVSLYKRSGGGRHSVRPWTDDPVGAEWPDLVAAQSAGGISRGFAYELEALAREGKSLPAHLLRDEARRILERKQEHANGKVSVTIPARVNDSATLREFSDQLIIARHLALYPAWNGGQS
jgi:CRISPR-associated protein Cmr2